MSENATGPAPSKLNKWEKADIVLKPVGGLLTALSVAFVGILGSQLVREQQEVEINSRLYAQLMSAREQSDSSLRQEMFKTIIGDFLAPTVDPKADPLDPAQVRSGYARDVLKLEILAYNFHDALDLAPLFKDVHQRLIADTEVNQAIGKDAIDEYLDRLEVVAMEVISKQVAALSRGAMKVEGLVRFRDLEESPGHLPGVINATAQAPTLQEDAEALLVDFEVQVLNIDRLQREVELRLIVQPKRPPLEANALEDLFFADDPEDVTGAEQRDSVDVTFKVGFFDFPMIDNTRLSNGMRCAVVLRELGERHASLALVYFPESRASLKEKPFYDEIVDRLMPEQV